MGKIGNHSEKMSHNDLSSECPLKTGCTYRGCPLIGVSHEDRFYCMEVVLSLECPLKTGFTVWRLSSHRSVP